MADTKAAATRSLDEAGCDTGDMLIAHRLLRFFFRDTPAIVRAVPEGDGERATFVADHLQQLTGLLHHHHLAEDTELWDRLSTKAPACSIHVQLMRKQHADMAVHIEAVDDARAAWARTPSAADRDALAARLEELLGALRAHLGDEETLILPEASKALTQREWNRLGEFANKAPKEVTRHQLVILGFLLEALGPAEGELFAKRHLPPPVRLLYRVVGRRQYTRYRQRLYGVAA
jgi:hemerythrin-like domain-containing protein